MNIFRQWIGSVVLGVFALPTGVAAAGDGKVIEIVTFRLKPGVSAVDFSSIDAAVERGHVSRQPGFLSRETAHRDGNEWLVIIHWRSVTDADASMASFEKAPAAARFMGAIEASTMKMTRYEK